MDKSNRLINDEDKFWDWAFSISNLLDSRILSLLVNKASWIFVKLMIFDHWLKVFNEAKAELAALAIVSAVILGMICGE